MKIALILFSIALTACGAEEPQEREITSLCKTMYDGKIHLVHVYADAKGMIDSIKELGFEDCTAAQIKSYNEGNQHL